MTRSPDHRHRKASVIGSGPNGLAAAIVLARAGLEVTVFEAQPTFGGGARTLDLTLPGFHHDFGSAVQPMAVGSPFFASLPLANYGLEWIHSPAVLAHPLDDGPAVILERSLADTEPSLKEDARAWRNLFDPLSTHWPQLAEDILRPIPALPAHPFLMARFGRNALLSASTLAHHHFRTEPVRALFAGLAAHSFLSLDAPLSASFGLVLGAAAHAVGWPIPRGGAQSLANALAAHLMHLGGRIITSTPITSLADLPASNLILCDISPRQLLTLAAPTQLSRAERRNLAAYKPGPAAFKVDYALSAPITWNDPACLRAATVHLGGSLDDIAASESTMSSGRLSQKPFVLLSQPTLFDPTRAPAGNHIAWAYCHVPNGSPDSASDATLDHLESQIERFATGFRGTILARHISSPATLESLDANLIGGDISGGAHTPGQLIFRPTRRMYRTSVPDIYLCSASTPPGGGVHGMCGYHAARAALRDHNLLP
jgi:phytoene dehydrogenase-like protein